MTQLTPLNVGKKHGYAVERFIEEDQIWARVGPVFANEREAYDYVAWMIEVDGYGRDEVRYRRV